MLCLLRDPLKIKHQKGNNRADVIAGLIGLNVKAIIAKISVIASMALKLSMAKFL